jgi:hypothetical protein
MKIKNMNILETLTLDTTYEHLASLYGKNTINDYFEWIGDNYHNFNMNGYGDMSNTLGVIEDIYGMYLLDITNWKEYQILCETNFFDDLAD